MTFIPPVSAGTVNLANGSTTVSGFGTNFLSAGAKGGDILVIGVTRVEIQEVVSNTNIELLLPWSDADIAGGEFYIVSRNAETLAAENATEVRRLLQQIRTGLLSRPDAFGTLPERDQFNNEPAGFIYHVLDEANQAVVGYYKTGDTASDWSVGISLRGDAGINGMDGQAFSHQGAGVPPSSLGADGQTYLRTSNFDVYENNGGTWSVTSNILAPIQNAISSQFNEILTRFDGVSADNGKLVGGFGARALGGILNWDHPSNARQGSGITLLNSATASNSPDDSNNAYHPFSFEQAESGNLTQFAIPYIQGSVHFRTKFNNIWNEWNRVIDTSYLDNDFGSIFSAANGLRVDDGANTFIVGADPESLTDRNNNFNSASGVFTAPVDGVYSFYAQTSSANNITTDILLDFLRNGFRVGNSVLCHFGRFLNVSNQINIRLDAGDSMQARVIFVGNNRGNIRNSLFSGQISKTSR